MIILLVAIALITGVLAGLLGIGGGMVLVPTLLWYGYETYGSPALDHSRRNWYVIIDHHPDLHLFSPRALPKKFAQPSTPQKAGIPNPHRCLRRRSHDQHYPRSPAQADLCGAHGLPRHSDVQEEARC